MHPRALGRRGPSERARDDGSAAGIADDRGCPLGPATSSRTSRARCAPARNFQHASLSVPGPDGGPRGGGGAGGRLLRNDAIWIALWDDRLPSLVAGSLAGEGRPSIKTVERIATAMGEVIDDAVREPGRSRRVAALAAELARMVGLSTTERRAIAVAATLLDVGQLGVPRHITEKPAILSVDEMEQVRHHPGWGRAYSRLRRPWSGSPSGSRRTTIAPTAAAIQSFSPTTRSRRHRASSRSPMRTGHCARNAPIASRSPPPRRATSSTKGAGTQYDGAIAELLEPALASCGCDSAESPV